MVFAPIFSLCCNNHGSHDEHKNAKSQIQRCKQRVDLFCFVISATVIEAKVLTAVWKEVKYEMKQPKSWPQIYRMARVTGGMLVLRTAHFYAIYDQFKHFLSYLRLLKCTK